MCSPVCSTAAPRCRAQLATPAPRVMSRDSPACARTGHAAVVARPARLVPAPARLGRAADGVAGRRRRRTLHAERRRVRQLRVPPRKQLGDRLRVRLAGLRHDFSRRRVDARKHVAQGSLPAVLLVQLQQRRQLPLLLRRRRRRQRRQRQRLLLRQHGAGGVAGAGVGERGHGHPWRSRGYRGGDGRDGAAAGGEAGCRAARLVRWLAVAAAGAVGRALFLKQAADAAQGMHA